MSGVKIDDVIDVAVRVNRGEITEAEGRAELDHLDALDTAPDEPDLDDPELLALIEKHAPKP